MKQSLINDDKEANQEYEYGLQLQDFDSDTNYILKHSQRKFVNEIDEKRNEEEEKMRSPTGK